MNDAPLTCVHGTEGECQTRLAYAAGRMLGHSPQLRFSRCSKTFYIENKPLSLVETSAKRLVQQMLERVKQLSTLCLQEVGIRAIKIKHRTVCAFSQLNTQI
jgi:hypothetical protein